jgi:hypothetical protein
MFGKSKVVRAEVAPQHNATVSGKKEHARMKRRSVYKEESSKSKSNHE